MRGSATATLSLTLTIVALLAAAGCGRVAASGPEVNRVEGNSGAAPAAAAPKAVRVRAVEVRAEPVFARELGRLLPWRRLTVAAEVPGLVTRVALEEAAVVPASPSPFPLAELEATRYDLAIRRARAAVDAATAARDLAAAEVRRVVPLVTKGQATEFERDRVEAGLKAAEADLAAAGVALADAEDLRARTRIFAPPGYRVVARLAEPGQVAGAGTPIATLIDDRRLRLDFEVSPADLATARKATRLAFETKGVATSGFGRLLHVGPEASAASGRFPAQLEVDNADGALIAGTTVVVLVPQAGTDAPLIVAPRAAIVLRLEEASVAVVGASGRVERRRVELLPAPHLPPGLAAVGGLTAGEEVAIESPGALRDGEVVVPIRGAER